MTLVAFGAFACCHVVFGLVGSPIEACNIHELCNRDDRTYIVMTCRRRGAYMSHCICRDVARRVRHILVRHTLPHPAVPGTTTAELGAWWLPCRQCSSHARSPSGHMPRSAHVRGVMCATSSDPHEVAGISQQACRVWREGQKHSSV
jgi:hypothetical protein